ncbi:PAS domain-containing protein [Sphingomonas sp.]|uniref:PAS domain-containing protein n=1 Tax=Sphingomonas sp. TaxID=28214 RepID=UPI0025FD6538|nr:PAS domain-containing protein [Sphingomonas sp.]
MLNATPDCIKVVSVDGTLLTMNRAGCLALNVPVDSDFGMPWLPLLPEDVHPQGEVALGKAAAGETARFPGRSLSSDGIVYWDNLLTPIFGDSGEVMSILCVSRDITDKTLLEERLHAAVDRETLLAREMRHRIKNMFSVVSGLVAISEKEAAASDTPRATTNILRERLDALSRASEAAFPEARVEEGDGAAVPLEPVLRSVLRPYGDRCTFAGPPLSIRRESIPTFALFLHELATNAVKYGALGRDGGRVGIDWETRDGLLDLTWAETGGPGLSAPPDHKGFGTQMVDRIVRHAGGTISRTWREEGLIARLRLPEEGR